MARTKKQGNGTPAPTFTGSLNVQSDDGPKTYRFENGVIVDVKDADGDDYNPSAAELKADVQELIADRNTLLRDSDNVIQHLKGGMAATVHGLRAERLELESRIYRIDMRIKALGGETSNDSRCK